MVIMLWYALLAMLIFKKSLKNFQINMVILEKSLECI